MSTIVTRAAKGSPLLHAEVDANFTNLNADKLEAGALANLVTGPVSATDNAIARMDGATGKIVQGSVVSIDDVGVMTVPATALPSAPGANNASLSVTSLVGRSMLTVIEDKIASTYMQPALYDGRYRFILTPSNATGGLTLGDTATFAGSFAVGTPTFASIGLLSWPLRSTYANVVTTLNQNLGCGGTTATFYRSTTAGSNGGFFFYCRWGFDTWTNGGRVFVGLSSTSNPMSADPSTFVNMIGFCVDAADNGAISFLTKDATTATKASTGLTITSGAGYDVWFFNPLNSGNIYWKITDVATGTSATGIATATLPAVNTRMSPQCRAGNAALTTATAVRISTAGIYCETAA